MTWPTAATKTHMDAGTDDPKQARSELADLVDQFNTLRSHFSSFMQTFVARTTAAAARGDLDAQQLINSLTEETSPATGDLIGLRDVSAGADRKMTLANALKVINSLSELTSVDGANDFLSIYDASAGTTKKVKPDNLGGVFAEDSGESSEITITSGGSFSFSHGLSGKPSVVQAYLRCKTNDQGHVAGAEIFINPSTLDGNDKGIVMQRNVSTISGRFGQDPATFSVLNFTTGAKVNLTNSSWRLLLRAWR